MIKENNKSTVIICELWLLYSPFNNFNCLSAIVSAVSTLCVGQCIACTANKALCFSVFSYVMRCSVVHSFSNKSSVLSHPSQHQIYDWQVLGGRKWKPPKMFRLCEWHHTTTTIIWPSNKFIFTFCAFWIYELRARYNETVQHMKNHYSDTNDS